MILPGETEAGTAGTQPCRGILRWAHRDDGQGREDRPCAAQPPSDRKTPCLKNPRPEGAESTLTENAVSPFHAEPTQRLVPVRAISAAQALLRVELSFSSADQ